jgi:hypothetical protein
MVPPQTTPYVLNLAHPGARVQWIGKCGNSAIIATVSNLSVGTEKTWNITTIDLLAVNPVRPSSPIQTATSIRSE